MKQIIKKDETTAENKSVETEENNMIKNEIISKKELDKLSIKQKISIIHRQTGQKNLNKIKKKLKKNEYDLIKTIIDLSVPIIKKPKKKKTTRDILLKKLKKLKNKKN